jgi:hypothetical protein
MKFIMEVELGNADMSEPAHLSRSLRNISEIIGYMPDSLDEIPESIPVRDMNGNKVGFWGVGE